jgi:hypothetical protein
VIIGFSWEIDNGSSPHAFNSGKLFWHKTGLFISQQAEARRKMNSPRSIASSFDYLAANFSMTRYTPGVLAGTPLRL